MSDPSKGGAKLHRSAAVPVQTGMSSIEYVIILILLAAIAVGAWKTFGENADLDQGVSLAAAAMTPTDRGSSSGSGYAGAALPASICRSMA